MSFVLFILIPVALVVAYALCRLALGRPLTRHTLNIAFALLLSGYFLTTAGLGIFWVANQELPVFDLHYLFGYVTLLIVFVHLAFNWRVITTFFRRVSPRPLVQQGGRTWRPAVRVAGWTAGLLLYGGAFFWLGRRQARDRIEITMAELPVAASPSVSTAGDVPAGEPVDRSEAALEPATPPATASQPMAGPVLPPAIPARRQLVDFKGQQRTLADYYHETTKHSRLSVMQRAGGLDWSRRPKVFKQYADAQVVDLPEPRRRAGMSVGAAIDACRRPVHGFASDALSLVDLSTLLLMTNGITATVRSPGGTYFLRAAPSAGALYPTVTYVLARHVEGLPPGLYHYAVNGHKLHRLRAGEELAGDLAALVPQGRFVEAAPVTIIFTAIYYRCSWKYDERAYRYCCLDAGHLAVQTALTTAALGYGSRPIGRFDDSKVNALLGVNEQEEGALLILPVGRPSERPPAAAGQAAMVVRPTKIGGEGNPILLLMHGGTCFGLAGEMVRTFEPRPPVEKSYPSLAVIPLPREVEQGDDLVPAILRRRSARNWANDGLSLRELSSVLYHAFGFRSDVESGPPDPSVEDNHALNLYVLVNNVEGLDPGVYYYGRAGHALSQIRRGDYRRAGYAMSLFQEVVGDCGAVLVMTIDAERLGYPDADRGYRYAAMDAGMLGGRVYLQSVGLGLGCCGIGAFFDDEVSELIGVSPDEELVIYLAAIGGNAKARSDK